MPIFECGFEAGSKDYYIAQGWTFDSATAAIVNTAGLVHKSMSSHGGNYALYDYDWCYTPSFGLGGRWLHFWYHPTATGEIYLAFNRCGSIQATLVFQSLGYIEFKKGIYLAATLSTAPINGKVDHWIAISADLTSTGTILVFVDGIQVANVTGDYQAVSGYTQWDQLSFSGSCYVDDIIVTSEAEGRLIETVIPVIVPDGSDTRELVPTGAVTTLNDTNTLPQATITVVSTTGFSASGTIYINTSNGVETITYTGVGATTFTGCSGGTGTMSVGGIVSQNANYSCVDEIPVSTSDYVSADAVDEDDTYTMTTLGWTPDAIHAIGLWTYAMRDGEIRYVNFLCKPSSTAYASEDVAVAAAGIWAGTLPSIWATKPAGTNTTVLAFEMEDLVLPQATIYVEDTTGFAASGTIYISTLSGVETITYTGTTATTFTGCSGGTGITRRGNFVSDASSSAWVITDVDALKCGVRFVD
jgi:hypothetical protein